MTGQRPSEPGFDDGADRLATDLAARLAAVRERMDAAGGEAVQLLAVSKAKPVEAVIAAQSLGLATFGENYAQELAAKASVIGVEAPIEWHFIGQLQSNKVRQICDVVNVWQSVDRLKVGREIARRAPGAVVYAQVNLADDPNKVGCSFDDVSELVDGLMNEGLQVTGLMGVGTAGDDTATAVAFGRLRSTVDRLGLDHCSMGMTNDLEIAIREGSTMVRVGTALFGPRT